MEGREHPLQHIGEGLGVVDGASVPSIGFADFALTPECTLEAPRYIIAITETGALSSVFDKHNGREVIADGNVGNDLQLLQDGPEHEDA